MPSEVTEEQLRMIERYVILKYDKASSKQSVNKCKKDLFSKMSRQIKNIPPTNATLLQNTNRTNLQAGYVWAQSTVRTSYLPNTQDWGWTRHIDNSLREPLWTDLSKASKACRELKCRCKSSCRKGSRCSCARANLKCTPLCVFYFQYFSLDFKFYLYFCRKWSKIYLPASISFQPSLP